jgi:dephospho-CoA kinase
MMKVYALTGGIAAGKSEASRTFEEQGIPVIDADRIAHQVMEPGGRAFDAVVAHFGDEILEAGRIDRARLAPLVFGNPEALARLNAMVHPAVQLEIAQRLAEISQSSPVAIVDAALHAENGKLSDGMSGLILVHAPEEQRIERMIEHRGLTREEAERRIASQTPPERKMPLATWVIENSGTIEELRRQVEAIAEEIRK